MSVISIEKTCSVHDSFRVQQIAGMFDVPLAKRSSIKFSVDVPNLTEKWTLGAIVGPSGSGKSTIAQTAFPESIYNATQWPNNAAVIDGFGEHTTRDITATLTAVGFSSPPAWVKPYAVLSNGEKFRCDLARALLGTAESNHKRPELVVFDEFTSVVDRTVAQVGSAAVSRAIRSGKLVRRFVAVSCHYDILPWLEPDWVLDMATNQLTWGRLRRPTLLMEVVQCPQAWWLRFARHHYLSGSLPRSATCYAALWHSQPVAFCASVGMFGQTGRKRISRIVVLPDYQGLGIGMRLVEHVSEHERTGGFRCNITASHPAVIAHCKKSPLWRTVGVKRAAGKSHQQAYGLEVKTAAGRSVVSFEYLGKSWKQTAQYDNFAEEITMTGKKQAVPTARSQAIYCRIVIEGCTPEHIAKEFKVSLQNIQRIVRQVRRWIRHTTSGWSLVPAENQVIDNDWQDNVNGTLLELRKLHLARLEHQWEQVMLGWYRSLQVEETEKVVGDEKGHRKAEKIRKTQTGDVAYLEQARKIMQEMRAIFPLQPADNGNQEQSHVENLTLEQREIAIDSLLETIRQRAGETASSRTSARKESAA